MGTTIGDLRASGSSRRVEIDEGSKAVAQVMPSSYFRWKVMIGRTLAALLLIPGLPVIGLLIVIVRLTSPGPGIYRQLRVGRHGQSFYIYKIRTMRNDAETVSGGPAWTQENDPRITRLGRVLRKLHLDEFPQLINVLMGEMCLIGPRPERPEFTQVLAREIPGYLERLAVPPGITGLAQINLPPDTDLRSVERKLVLDLEYVRCASVALDVRMILCTFLRLCGLRGDYAMRVMGLKRKVHLEHDDRHDDALKKNGPLHATPESIVTANGNDSE